MEESCIQILFAQFAESAARIERADGAVRIPKRCVRESL